tara:strand:- start:431 stop:697 length:267 start_codon:yes stop_codon:yes gene_type:complete
MRKSVYDPSEKELSIAKLGRKLMDLSENMYMKGFSDAEIGRSNRMSTFGHVLTGFGTTFGARNLDEVLKKSGVSKEEAEEFMQIAYKA